MSEQTLAQRRAADALGKVHKLQAEGQYGKYVSYVKGLPATILANGLGQAAATLLSAANGSRDDPNHVLYEHLSSWLCRDDGDAPYDSGDLLEAITQNDEDHYIRAQAEALAYLEWLKRFAAALLEESA
ncbi:MAG: type III-B CRISPR module-associated protein Cmr5 [Salinibacter sp.]